MEEVMSTRSPLRRALIALVAVVLVPIAGCARHDEPPTADAVADMRDFEIDLSTTRLLAGHRVIGLTNHGPTVHELVIARTDLPADALPLGADGISVDEDSRRFRILGEEESVQLTEQDVLDLVLEPGHYVLFCNLEGHYLGGMHADLEVTR